MPEEITVGSEVVSLQLTCKTKGDLIVTQHAGQRWFESREDAAIATAELLRLFIEVFQRPVDLRPELREARREERDSEST